MSIKIKKIRVGIVGASGYTGSELIRLLLNHPNVNISFALSKTNSHKKITDLYNDLIDETDLSFVDKFNNDVDVIFLCSGHNKSIEFINNNQIKNTTKIIDLSQDFRNNNFHEKSNRKFVYGLPEINKKIISRSKNIANPGCFATAILLGLIPSIKYNFPEDDIHINAITGSTGAGIIPKESSHFSWRNNNITWYKPFEHQHLEEINNILKGVNEKEHNLNLITYRGPFSRGIYCTSYFKSSKTIEQITECYKKFYLSASFVKISKNEIDLKNVVNSNKCLINLKKINDKILVTSVIDNLIKGASGQAIQNMNIMFGIEDLAGINLKSIIY